MALILDISTNEHLSVSLYAPGASVQSYETLIVDRETVRQTSDRIMDLLEQSALTLDASLGVLHELKQNGHLLFDYLIPTSIKQRLRQENFWYLTLLIDESLVFIPWELLFDGQEFLCRRFNIGRCVKTGRTFQGKTGRPVHSQLSMHVMADPQGNLPQARREASLIRDAVAASQDIAVTTKTKNIYKHYVQKNIREYDICHYAGHADFDVEHPQNSGWLLRDGKITCDDFARLGDNSHWPSLMFMNACQSALSLKNNQGAQMERGLFGLANTFLMSGGRFVIGTLTRVVDDSAMEMAVFFYRHLTAKENTGRCLREARNDFVRKFGEHQLAWASYVLYGDPSGSVFPSEASELVQTQPKEGHDHPRQPLRGRGWYLLALIVFFCGLLWLSVPHYLASQQKKLAWQRFSEGSYEQAAISYRQALRYVSNDERAALGLYHAYVQSGQYDEAVKGIEKIVSSSRKKLMDRRTFALNWALAQGYYILEDYSKSYETFSKILDFDGQSPQERLKLYEYLANAASLAFEFESADQWYQKAIQLADELSAPDSHLRMIMARADNIQLVDANSNSVLSRAKAQELYEDVIRLTSSFQHIDFRVQAQARLGQLFEKGGDFGQAVTLYQKALTDWKNFGTPRPVVSQLFMFSQVHLDLAALLIDSQLNFKEALAQLKEFDLQIRQAISLLKEPAFRLKPNGIPAIETYQESVRILLRQFEVLLIHLVHKGYQNSDLYREAGRIYDQLIKQYP